MQPQKPESDLPPAPPATELSDVRWANAGGRVIPTTVDKDSDLPFCLRESTFRLYEPFIAEAVNHYPDHITINPAPLRASTVAARIRDAMLSFERFNWQSSLLTWEDFATNRKLLVVAHGDSNVVIGPRATISKLHGKGLHLPMMVKTSGIRFDVGRWCPDDIVAVCLLISHRLLTGPITILPPIDISMQIILEERYDVAFTSTDTQTTIL